LAAGAEALGQPTTVPEPAQTANAIEALSTLSNGIKQAHNAAPCLADDQQDRDLYNRVQSIAGSIMKLNEDKIYISLKTELYQSNRTPPKQGPGSWQELQKHLKPVAQEIAEVLDLMQTNGTYLIRISNLQSNATLFALLRTQKDAYEELANLADPDSDESRQKVRALADQINSLLTSVLELERQIENFVKHPPDTAIKSCGS
jgi:hypothetical protein